MDKDDEIKIMKLTSNNGPTVKRALKSQSDPKDDVPWDEDIQESDADEADSDESEKEELNAVKLGTFGDLLFRASIITSTMSRWLLSVALPVRTVEKNQKEHTTSTTANFFRKTDIFVPSDLIDMLIDITNIRASLTCAEMQALLTSEKMKSNHLLVLGLAK